MPFLTCSSSSIYCVIVAKSFQRLSSTCLYFQYWDTIVVLDNQERTVPFWTTEQKLWLQTVIFSLLQWTYRLQLPVVSTIISFDICKLKRVMKRAWKTALPRKHHVQLQIRRVVLDPCRDCRIAIFRATPIRVAVIHQAFINGDYRLSLPDAYERC